MKTKNVYKIIFIQLGEIYEVFAKQIPLAGSIAEKMLYALSEDKLVPPEIISDRYVFYRVPEYLQSYIDYYGESSSLPLLPYEKEKLSKYFELSKILKEKTQHVLFILQVLEEILKE